MTRKDYIAIAQVLRKHITQREMGGVVLHPYNLVVDLCEIFATDNPRFDEHKFMAAIYES